MSHPRREIAYDCRGSCPGNRRDARVYEGIVDAETQQILGCAMLSIEGGEVMTIIQVAMMGKLLYTALQGRTRSQRQGSIEKHHLPDAASLG